MTTLDPGASVVFTHGLRARPRSTAFLASSAAPIMSYGLEVLVHLVMAAMTTAPWSSSNSLPSSPTTRVGLDGQPSAPFAALTSTCGLSAAESAWLAGESDAGNDSALAS